MWEVGALVEEDRVVMLCGQWKEGNRCKRLLLTRITAR